MNRNQRRLGRQHQKRYDEAKYAKAVLEVLPPKSKRDPVKLQKFTTNKCCFVTPVYEDFGQITEASRTPVKYSDVLKEQFGFDPLMPETISQLKELRKVLCNNTAKVENCSQYAEDGRKRWNAEYANIDGTQWQTVDNNAEIDKYIAPEKEKLETCLFLPDNNVRISETPRIKIIAKKFSKCKRDNIELRRLDENVVCVEYDVFSGEEEMPKKTMRAFFSIKPGRRKKNDEKEDKCNMATDNELNKFTEKEIEIINGKIQENKSYLEDLKRILRREQAIFAKRNKSTLDLMSLYEMAKKESPPLQEGFSNTNFLSKAELQEMKNLILKNCASSAHGISRRTLKTEPEANCGNLGLISQSIVAELWREGDNIGQ